MYNFAVDVTIRRETPADVIPLDGLLLAAFPDEGPVIVALVADLRRHPCGRDHLAWVAKVDGEVVGFVMVTRNRLDTAPRTIEVGVLSPLAVAPTHQHAGIGSALVTQAVEGARAAGLPALFLEGDPAYYQGRGFVPGEPLGFRKPSLRIPDEAFQVVLLPSHEEWMSGTLVYAEPFWDHDCVGLRD